MLNFSKTKVICVYLVFLIVSMFTISNFIESDKNFLKKKFNLGLDLQGGSYLLLEVDSTSLEKRRLQSKAIPLKKTLKKNSINYQNFIVSDKNIRLRINKIDFETFDKIFNKKEGNDVNIFLDEYNAFELEHEIVNNEVVISLSKHGIIKLRTAAVEQSIEIVRRRIDEIGTKEPSILKGEVIVSW